MIRSPGIASGHLCLFDMATHNVVLGNLACSHHASYRMPAHTNMNPSAQHDHHHDTPDGISRPPAYQHLGLARQDSLAIYH
jgi:hypothetical protein